MRGLIWFLPDFRDWPLAVTQGLHKRSPNWTFCGIVSGFPRDHTYVECSTAPQIRPLYFMDRYQRDWLARPVEPNDIAKYERILGSQALNRILIADRNVGRGFISGVFMPETPLMRLTSSHDGRMRYIVGLLDFLFEIFERERLDFVFAPGVAGALAMALATVSLHFKINFRCLLSTRIGTRHAVTNSPVGLSATIEQRFQKACQNPSVVEEWYGESQAIIAAFHDRPHGLRDTDTSWQRAARPLRPIDMMALIWRTFRRRPPELINLPYPSNYFLLILESHPAMRRR